MEEEIDSQYSLSYVGEVDIVDDDDSDPNWYTPDNYLPLDEDGEYDPDEDEDYVDTDDYLTIDQREYDDRVASGEWDNAVGTVDDDGN